ncbi:unnamed protein product [Ambrosiozyma monospora]|uniref:Unnamed protein product n=1 Tax=Ambrosiozyma monospora TaxID=43982 RepID=A0A9W6Z2S5_AMBMO|nr:unnamed protein product [Ambrosiozyma monospora]
MCMRNPTHVYNHCRNSSTPLCDYSINMNDINDSSSISNTRPYPADMLEFEQLEFDPSLDLSNMDQYQSKNYKVKTVYQKIETEKVGGESSNEDVENPPSYDKLYQAQPRLPAYRDLEKMEAGEFIEDDSQQQLSEEEEMARNKAHRARMIHYLFIWLIMLFFLFPFDSVPFGCDMTDDSDEFLDQEALTYQIHTTSDYNKGNIVYSITFPAEEEGQYESDTMWIIF